MNIIYSGTATRLTVPLFDLFTVPGVPNSLNNSGYDSIVLTATAGQTLVITVTGELTGSGVVADHAFLAAVSAQSI
jgi:hypothetical protein